MYGDAGNDTIKGGAGNDAIEGGADNDKLYGDAGNDTIKGGAGNDAIEGGAGNDKLYGDAGDDTIKGGAGNDAIEGGADDDKLYGDAGNDTIKGGTGNDKLYGGAGDDKIYVGAGDDYVDAGKGTNSIYFGKNEGYNTVVKGGGTDTIIFSSENNIKNIKYAYSGNNLILTANGTSVVLENYKNGHSAKYIKVGKTQKTIKDFLKSATKTTVVPEPTPVNPPAPAYSIINGTAGNEYLPGSNGADKIYGYAGNDTIDSYPGNDTINGGTGNNWLYFYPGDGKDIVENGGGTDTIFISGLISNMAKSGNNLVITYGYNETITIQNYYTTNHSVKYIQSANSGEPVTVNQMIDIIQNGGSGPINPPIEDNNKYQKIKFNNSDANILFAKSSGEEETTIGNTGNNYVYADDDGSIIKGGSGKTYMLGSKGDDKFYGGAGDEYFMGGAGKNEIYISKNGGQDTLSLSSADEDNTVIFNDIEFTLDNEGKVINLGNLVITDKDVYDNTVDTLYIKGYGTSNDYVQAPNYFYSNPSGYKFYYEGYTLQDKNGNKISLADAVKMYINREADTDYTVGNQGGNSTNEEFYVNSTNEAPKIISRLDITNGSVNAGAGNDTIYSGSIYQSAEDGTYKPYIYGGEGNDEIHAEGNKIYFTTSKTGLNYSDTDLIAIQTHQTNGNTTTTTIYDTDHIYITPDNKVMTGYFFFAYELGQNSQGYTTVNSVELPDSDKYERIGTYTYTDTEINIPITVYHTDELINSKVEGYKTYFFDYGDKVASGQVTISGAEGDDKLFIGNGSSAYGGEGNDTIIGDGQAYGGEGNDKIVFSSNNHYFQGMGFTYYYVDANKGNDYIDFSEVTNREHDNIELSSGTVEYDTELPQIEFSEGIDTLILNPKDTREIAIDMSEFAPAQRDTSRWYMWHHVDTDTQFGAFQRGDDLYLIMNDSSSKNGTLIIKDWFAYEKDEDGNIKHDEFDEPIRVFSDERRESIKICFEPTLRYDGYNMKPQSYMSLEKFIQYQNGKAAVDEYGYYNISVSGGGYKNTIVNEKNAYFTFIDNQKENPDAVINENKETPTFFNKELENFQQDAQMIQVYRNAGYYIIGGDGAQTINGGEGDDVIYGDNIGSHDENGKWIESQNGGNDKIFAGAGDDYIEAGEGDDLVDGGLGQNVIYGGKGNDTLVAGNPDSDLFNANSFAYGEDGDDVLYAQAVVNDEEIDAEASKSYLGEETNKGRQYLYGGAGNDTIVANGYSATVEAGAGDDTVYLYNNNGVEYAWWNSHDTSTVSLGAGNDKFYASGSGAFLVEANSGNNLIDASESFATGNYIYGGTGTDTIKGGSGKDFIVTGLGNAIVLAGDGDDEISSGNQDYYSMNDVHMQTEVHGGAGADTISVHGKSFVFGDEGNDVISLDGSSKYVPSALTVDGGTGDDIYRGYGTGGVNTLIASSGADKIQFLGVQAKAFKFTKDNNDLIISTTRTYDGTGLTVLKDYYVADKQALFNNWTVETYTGDDISSPKRNTFSMTEFINYISGSANIISGSEGTEYKDYMEAANDVTAIYAKGGDDNIIAAEKTSFISGGAGNDNIITSTGDYTNKQIILGDSGTASVVDSGDISGSSNVPYTINYNPADDSSADGNDTIVSYGERSYIWGEGGNDDITLMNGSQSHVWGGAGNDTITAIKGSAQQIYGDAGDDVIKGKGSFIDGGDGNDDITHKYGGYSSYYGYDTYALHKDILKNKYNATDEWINKLSNVENSIYRKAGEVSAEYQNAEEDKNNISWYEYVINLCETNGYKYYGQTSLNDYRRYLANSKAHYYGSKQEYEELESAVTAARAADIESNKNDSLNGVKGSKDRYIDTMLNTNSTQEQKDTARATYETDMNRVKTYQEFVDKYDDLTYNGWDYNTSNYYSNDDKNFREEAGEAGKAYWEDKLAQAKHDLDGIASTQAAYDNLHARREYSIYINNQNKLQAYQDYLNILNNGGSSNDYTGPTFKDISQDTWFNKADLLSDNIKGCEGTKNVYLRFKSYVDNYDDNEWMPENYVSPVDETTGDPLYANFREEGDKAYWIAKQNAAYEVYQNDEYLCDLYKTYAEFYYDEEFNDPLYASHTLIVKNDGESPAYVSFRDEAEQCYSAYYDGSPSYYWSRMADLIKNRMNGCQGTNSIEEEMYMRYQAGQIPYSTYKDWHEKNERNIDEYKEYNDFYENYDNPAPSVDVLREYSKYIGDYSKDNLEASITQIRTSINGSSAEYQRLRAELDAMVAQFKEDAPREIALKLVAHLQEEIILGGSGNDTISIGHIDEDDEYYSGGRVFAAGQEGDDTYIIDSLIEGNYTNNVSASAITIYDNEGTNTIKFNTDDLKSGNVGMYLNVELKKDEYGNYRKDANGNYLYNISNFGTSYSGANSVKYNLENTPLYDGDAGYAVVFVDNETFKDTLNQFNYGGLSDQAGVKFDADTLNHIDYIWSADGKYITKAQIDAAAQKTANWLAQNGYDSFMSALDNSDVVYDRPKVLNELRNFENLGSLEWITPNTSGVPNEADIIEPATEGLVGTNTNDTLVINSAPVGENNVIDFKYGNDKVTFEGAFGDYIVQSSSTKDNDNVARQSDTISLAGYSVTGGTLRFSQNDKDLVITAYNGEDKVGSITYKDFLGSEYSVRSFVLKADDHDYLVSKETASKHVITGSNQSDISIKDDENPYYNIRFVEGIDDKKVYLNTNGNRAYYYTLDNTPLALRSIKEGEPVEIFSQGSADDSYSIGLTEQTNLIIHDAGGTNDISIGNASWDGSGAVTDSKFRLFFDIDQNGVVSDTKHIIWTEKFKPYETVLVKSGNTYNEEKAYYYDTENLLKLLNNDSDHMIGALTFDGEIKRIQTDDRYDHNDRLVYAEDVDESILPEKYIRGIATDVVPWLKENNYESVSDALTKLKAEIAAKQELIAEVATDSDEFTTYKNAIAAAQGKIDTLLDYFNIGYGDVLLRNLYGTEENDILNASSSWSSTDTKRIEGDKGDDTINVNSTEYINRNIIYSFDRGDGHDTLIAAFHTETIYVDRADKTMHTKLHAIGWDLRIEFYSVKLENEVEVETLEGSIRIQDYFKQTEDKRLDNLVIQSTGNADQVLSIKDILTPTLEHPLPDGISVINRENVYISTTGDDNIPASENNRYIYIGSTAWDEHNNNTDVIANSSGNDEIYISKDKSKTDITYTVGSGGDDIIAGSFWQTGLVIDYADTNAQTEYRKIGDDMKMLFFMGNGDAKHKVGSITFKDYYHWSSSKIGDAYDIDSSNFIFRTGTGDEKVNSVTLLEDYRLLGGSLDFDDTKPFFGEITATNGREISADATENTLVFTDADNFRDLTFAVNGEDLVVTNTKTSAVTTIKGYTTGNYAINHIRVGNIVKDINDNKVIPSYDELVVPTQKYPYTDIPFVLEDGKIIGTYGSDHIVIPNGTNNVSVDTRNDSGGDNGNDKVEGENVVNTEIKTYGYGDIVEITGHKNSIDTGSGNDVLRITTNSEIAGEENILVFDGSSEYDTVENCSGNILLDIKRNKTQVEFERFGDDLLIRNNGVYGTVNIKGYFDMEHSSNKNANFSIKVNGDEEVKTLDAFISEYLTRKDIAQIPHTEETTMTTTNHFTSSGNDYIVLKDNLENPITNIASSGGNDTIIAEIDNSTIDGGWDDDVITVTGNGNTLRGDKGVDMFNIYASEGDTNTLIYDENYQNSGDSDIVNAIGGNLKLKFSECWISDITLARKDDYLVIRYYNNKSSVFIKDYFNDNVDTANITLIAGKNNYEISLDDFITQNYSSTTNLFEVWGTEENDKFIHEILDKTSVTYNFGKGNDTLEFVNISESNKDNITRKAVINSVTETDKYHNVTNKDTVVLGGYHDGNTGYSNKHRYAFGEDGDIIVSAVHDVSYNSHKKIVTDVTYSNFLNRDANGAWVTPDLEVKDFADSSATYQIKRYDSAQTLDTYYSYLTINSNLQQEYEDIDAVYIKASGSESSKVYGNGGDHILTDGGAGLNYIGAGDRIITNSTSSNDTYTVGLSSSGTTTYIKDNGGNDTLEITGLVYDAGLDASYPDSHSYNDLKNLYLAFNVNKDGSMGDTFVITKNQGSSSQIYDASRYLSGETDTISNNNIVITAARTDEQKAANILGIESISAYKTDYDNSTYDSYLNGAVQVYRDKQIKIADIDMTSWCNDIKEQVVSWLNANGFDSTADVFGLDTNDDTNAALVNELYAIYDAKNASMYLQ